jgi:hypothetical protein
MAALIQIGEFRPDLPEFGNDGATVALNVVPAVTSYRPLASLSPYSDALSARCQGAFATRDSGGNVHNFAGDAGKLYSLAGQSWSDVSRSTGGPYSTPSDGMWSFGQFGNLVIAMNGVDAPQKWQLGASTRFEALSGGPPVARFCAVVRDFLVMGRISGYANRVQWSAIDDGEAWTPSATTQADGQDLPDGGWVQGVAGGEYGTVFQEKSIKRMTYVGAPIIFQFDEVAHNRGVVAEGSMASFDATTFFLDTDGLYALVDGRQVMPIGDQKVDKTFWRRVNQSYLHRIRAAIDPINKLYVLAYPTQDSTDGTLNRLLIYNWTAGRWSEAEIEAEVIYRSLSGASETLDSLDSVSASLDALGFSLDSRVWTGGLMLLSAFDPQHRLCLFTGESLAATVETGETQLFPGRRALVTSVRPIVDGAEPIVQVGTRNRIIDPVIWGAESAINAQGECPLRSAARYHRARLSLPPGGGWEHLQGVDLTARAEGIR